MYMKCFLVALAEVVKKDYPDINLNFIYHGGRSSYIWVLICR